MQPPGTEIESEVDDGCEPSIRFSGQHRAIAQCRVKRFAEVLCQIDFTFSCRDLRMDLRAEVAVADRPEACRTNIRDGGDLHSSFDPALKALKLLG